MQKGIRLLRKKRLEESLKDGYQAMADENLLLAEEMIRLQLGSRVKFKHTEAP